MRWSEIRPPRDSAAAITEAAEAPMSTRMRVNFAYMTSCRWVDCSSGSLLESLTHELRAGTSRFSRRFDLVAVLCDDNDEEYRRAWENGPLWPGDLDVPTVDGEGRLHRQTIESLTFRISSGTWRPLEPNPSEPFAIYERRKARAKARYERSLLRRLDGVSADLILIDSYLPIIGPDLLKAFRGRILNVHPAISELGDPLRLPGRHPTRDTYTRAAFGIVIVDDKRRVGIPDGARVLVECDGVVREAVEVGKSRESGVSVHVVTDTIDSGPVIACDRYVLSEYQVSMAGIRRKNQMIKKRLVPRALLAYTDRLDVQRMIREARERRFFPT